MCKVKPGWVGAHLHLKLVGRLRLKDLKFKTSLGDLARPCLRIKYKGLGV